MQLGQAGPNFQSVATARGAAYKVFLIIDRVRAGHNFVRKKRPMKRSRWVVTCKTKFGILNFNPLLQIIPCLVYKALLSTKNTQNKRQISFPAKNVIQINNLFTFGSKKLSIFLLACRHFRHFCRHFRSVQW